jgi:heat shock 70kDa protein 4
VQREAQLAAADKLAIDTAEARNDVEEYVYNTREKLYEGAALYPYIDEATREQYKKDLQATEDWLYDEGENETVHVYKKRLADLKVVGGPAAARLRESENRDLAAKEVL